MSSNRSARFSWRRLFPRRRTMMVCESCELTGGPFPAAEAAALLQVHRQLQHGAVPDAYSSSLPEPN